LDVQMVLYRLNLGFYLTVDMPDQISKISINRTYFFMFYLLKTHRNPLPHSHPPGLWGFFSYKSGVARIWYFVQTEDSRTMQ
jgi:hypothetical protein